MCRLIARCTAGSLALSLGGDRAAFAVQVEQLIVDTLAEVKPGRQLYANVEFYAGVVMDACGVPRDMFTPTFASSRVIGWCANVLEQAASNKIIRRVGSSVPVSYTHLTLPTIYSV